MSEETQIPNPLLNGTIVPGETFRLPSQGLFYKNGELSDGAIAANGEVYVSAMTSYDELQLNSPDLVLNGKALDSIFRRCVPDVLEPGKLLARDVDFLWTCIRIVTYGPDLALSYNHECSAESKDHSYNVGLMDFIQHAKRIDPTTVSQSYSVTMPNGVVVKLRPATYEAMLEFSQRLDVRREDVTIEAINDSSNRVLASMCESVGETTNEQHIFEWLSAISGGWRQLISEAIDNASNWGIEYRATKQCRDCGKDIEIPFTTNPVSFFF